MLGCMALEHSSPQACPGCLVLVYSSPPGMQGCMVLTQGCMVLERSSPQACQDALCLCPAAPRHAGDAWRSCTAALRHDGKHGAHAQQLPGMMGCMALVQGCMVLMHSNTQACSDAWCLCRDAWCSCSTTCTQPHHSDETYVPGHHSLHSHSHSDETYVMRPCKRGGTTWVRACIENSLHGDGPGRMPCMGDGSCESVGPACSKGLHRGGALHGAGWHGIEPAWGLGQHEVGPAW